MEPGSEIVANRLTQANSQRDLAWTCYTPLRWVDRVTEQVARDEFNYPTALFRDMGMDWWTEHAEGLRGRIDRRELFKWFAPYVDGPPVSR